MQADYSLRDISQSSGEVLVKTDDKRITIAAKSLLIIPQRTDKVEICGKVYQVLNVKEVNPAGIVIKYDVQGRL